MYRKGTREWRVGKHKTQPDEARGSSTRGTNQARYANTAGWEQATILIGPQGFNRGEAHSGYVVAYGQAMESMDVCRTPYVVEGGNR